MICGKCGQENAESVQFCTRCHTTLKFVCPACKHIQAKGGKCEQCGVDFAKYAMMVQSKAKHDLERENAHVRERTSLLRGLVYFPLNGGLSLIRYLRSRLLGD